MLDFSGTIPLAVSALQLHLLGRLCNCVFAAGAIHVQVRGGHTDS